MIIQDTREQKPLWDPAYYEVKMHKLDEGDYTTLLLYNKAHIERKSGIDLYGSIIQGHERFVKEIKRAKEKKIIFAIFVECAEETFYRKRFKGGYRLKTPPNVLRKILNTMKIKYILDIVWCNNRDDLRDKMLLWFVDKQKKLNISNNENKEKIIYKNGKTPKNQKEERK